MTRGSAVSGSTALAAVVALTWLLAVPGCRDAGPGADSGGDAAAASGVEAAVRAVEERWLAALVARDSAGVAVLLAPDFVLRAADSPEPETRAQYVASVALPDRTLRPLVLEERQVTVRGDSAIATGRTAYIGEWHGNGFDIPVRYRHAFVRQDGAWLLAEVVLTETEAAGGQRGGAGGG